LAEAYDQEEVNSRLSDPVFASLIDDEEQDDEWTQAPPTFRASA
jgi:hypothetical protein